MPIILAVAVGVTPVTWTVCGLRLLARRVPARSSTVEEQSPGMATDRCAAAAAPAPV